MIKKILLLFVILLFLTAKSFPQIKASSLDSLRQKLENFDYPGTINLADSLLKFTNNPTPSQLIGIYRMKGISEFSLLDNLAAKNSFLSILKIDKNYELDSAKTSPKIITFFDSIKKDFITQYNKQKKYNSEIDSLYSARVKMRSEENINKFKNSMYRSLILPGWGHLYLGEKPKGIILTTLSSASLAAALYFIVDSNSKFNDYVRATDPAVIAGNRKLYYNSNQWKNISLISFSVLWLYSQIDLLFLHDFTDQGTSTAQNLPMLKYDLARGIQLSYQLSF
ncbi:MAG: hypothetical protein WB779_15855 [Ignavibacteriaceae bacterium]